ncbi:MAG: hypothetical protein L3K03_06715 [Thermoplasmata archaeon]|nr:hypothetical protein [Thermoplasmata archaeon]
MKGVPLDAARELRAELNRVFASDDHSYRAEFQSHEGDDGTLAIVQLGVPRVQAQEPLNLAGFEAFSATKLAPVVLGRLEARASDSMERSTDAPSPIWCDPA